MKSIVEEKLLSFKTLEQKVFTMYEGWDARSPKRSRLVNKRMLAGMEKSTRFHQKREALIEKVYDVDEIGQRILNGNGGAGLTSPMIRKPFSSWTGSTFIKRSKRRSGIKKPRSRSGRCWRRKRQRKYWNTS